MVQVAKGIYLISGYDASELKFLCVVIILDPVDHCRLCRYSVVPT